MKPRATLIIFDLYIVQRAENEKNEILEMQIGRQTPFSFKNGVYQIRADAGLIAAAYKLEDIHDNGVFWQ